MARDRYSTEQTIGMFCEVEGRLAQGKQRQDAVMQTKPTIDEKEHHGAREAAHRPEDRRNDSSCCKSGPTGRRQSLGTLTGKSDCPSSALAFSSPAGATLQRLLLLRNR